MRKIVVWAFAGLVWAGAVGIGAQKLLLYELTPGQLAEPSPRWPADSALPREPGRFTLVVFAHPDCPCTKATLVELGKLAARLEGRMSALVEFAKPEAMADEVRHSSRWHEAGAVPGVVIGFDTGDVEVRRFGVATSGQALLYDGHGNLVFSGGITSARGHEGPNAGSDAVVALVNGSRERFHNPVFGCSLRNPGAAELGGNSGWKRP